MIARMAILALLWVGTFAGTLKLAFEPPLTSDSTGCGSMDGAPDFDHYLLHLYRCGPFPPIVFSIPGDVDSADFDVLDGVVGWAEAWSVDPRGNQSCNSKTVTYAFPAVGSTPPPTGTDGIVGSYYRGLYRSGAAIDTIRSNIDYAWGLGSACGSCPADSFSAEWRGWIVIPTTGSYTFFVESEDGIQLFIDGTLGINKLVFQPVTEWSWTVNLTAGTHVIQLIYMGRVGNSQVKLRWSGPGIPKGIIPRSVFR